ncbi:MAG: DNA repair protein RadA [Leptospiraceae bacterium]|nr:DNA repair protein RadA [Leptospiraceae bacterium]MDW7976722.1 DNA repair protein RadA [Leptospiraceae bacterium]
MKEKRKYICSNCGELHLRWNGKCHKCGSWNTIIEIDASTIEEDLKDIHIQDLSDINTKLDYRIKSGIPDLDLVLGGGFVPGSLILLGGEPGVGKSTLMLTIAENFAKSQKKVLYFSGEESPEQIKIRAERLKISGKNIYLSKETHLSKIIALVLREKPELVIIDSVQTIQTENGNLPGTVSQLKYVAFQLMEIAKQTYIPMILIGHITREGTIAGPKLLEHMVDTVLYFESDRLNHFRILRAIKNRFGNVGEVALFEMHPDGLKVLQTIPQEIHRVPSAGCAYSAILEGSRSIAVEVQALVTRTNHGPTKRMAEGLDVRRVIQITAVMEKFLKINLNEQDVFTNLAGGLTAHEPGLDLAIATAILSSHWEKPIPKTKAFLGEIGLTGEIRPIPRINARVKELHNLGVSSIIIPVSQKKEVDFLDLDIKEIEHIKDIQGVFHEE